MPEQESAVQEKSHDNASVAQLPERRGLKKGVYLLPNLVTTGALFSGFYAIIAAMTGAYEMACIAIVIAGLPSEYRFEVILPDPIFFPSNTSIWFEVVQVGDIGSLFRWENSATDGQGKALRNEIVPNWALSGVADVALQLSTVPEPASLSFVGLGACVFLKRGTV